MNTDTALPVATNPVAEVSGQQIHDAAAHEPTDTTNESGESQEGGEGEEQKPQKTPEQREIERLRRAVDRKTRQLYEARAAREQQLSRPTVTAEPGRAAIAPTQAENEPLTLTRAELDRLVKEQAAQAVQQRQAESSQQAEAEHRRGIVQQLAKTWGQEKFDAVASSLDDALDGLAGANGAPKPVTEAIFESDNPAALIEYLADPSNADEAAKLSGLNERQAGRAIALLETKLKTTAKPQRSNAPAPLEPLKGAGKSSGSPPNPGDTKAYIKWANEQEFGSRR